MLSDESSALTTDSTATSETNGKPAQAIRISRDQHCVSRSDISSGCLKVLYTLNEAGFEAFIVGGGVRDLLLGLNPKDFDVATNAKPEEITELFRSSRIIGRRFRIVHVRMGREIIEVSTFRAAPEESLEVAGESLSRKVTDIESARSASGMLLRDNVYGDITGDALRRDFTVNALYYTVKNYEIHDFVNGIDDMENRVIRMIGDPVQRYREDPVRTLRAIRLAVKLNFAIDPDTANPISECAQLLESIPAARLFDECMKLFSAGHALQTWKSLQLYGITDILFPHAAPLISEDDTASHFLEQALANTDTRLEEGHSVAPYFLLAVILWPAVESRYKELNSDSLPPLPAMGIAGDEVISSQVKRIAIPRRFSSAMKEIWEMQLRLTRRTSKRVETLSGHRRFRAAYDFLVLREQAGYPTDGLGDWWTRWQEAGSRQQEEMVAEASTVSSRAKKRKRKVKSRTRRPRKDNEQQYIS